MSGDERSDIVYLIKTDCGSGYTGETKKRILSRNTEHEKAIFKGDIKNDALAEHIDKCKCSVKWDEVKTLAIETNYFQRKVRESLEIRRLKTGPGNEKGLNRDIGDYVTTNYWDSLFENVNELRKDRMINDDMSNLADVSNDTAL